MRMVPNLAILGMVISLSANAAAIKEIKSAKSVESKTIAQLLPVVKKIHKAAEKEMFWERRALAHKVIPGDEGEKAAILELVDKVNTFHTIESGEEDAWVKSSAPTFKVVYKAFLSEYDAEEAKKLPKPLLADIRELTSELAGIVRNPRMAFYEIYSSNEAQGHVGFVLYNRRTQESLYVSVVSDH